MKKTVTLNDKTFEVMIPAHEIDRAVAAVAERLNADTATRSVRSSSGCSTVRSCF